VSGSSGAGIPSAATTSTQSTPKEGSRHETRSD
jgi:hypothetical protein